MSGRHDSAERLARAATAVARTIGVAESLTGGALSSKLAQLPDASVWFRGAVVAYSPTVKHDLFGVPEVAVVSRTAAITLADGVARLLQADVAIAVTGVGGPEAQDGVLPGTVWMALHAGAETTARCFSFYGEPAEVVEQTCVAAIDWLAEHLVGLARSR